MNSEASEPFYGGITSFSLDDNEETGEEMVVDVKGVDLNPPGDPVVFTLDRQSKIDTRPDDAENRLNTGMVGVAYLDDWLLSGESAQVVSVWVDFNQDVWWTEEEGEVEP